VRILLQASSQLFEVVERLRISSRRSGSLVMCNHSAVSGTTPSYWDKLTTLSSRIWHLSSRLLTMHQTHFNSITSDDQLCQTTSLTDSWWSVPQLWLFRRSLSLFSTLLC